MGLLQDVPVHVGEGPVNPSAVAPTIFYVLDVDDVYLLILGLWMYHITGFNSPHILLQPPSIASHFQQPNSSLYTKRLLATWLPLKPQASEGTPYRCYHLPVTLAPLLDCPQGRQSGPAARCLLYAAPVNKV